MSWQFSLKSLFRASRSPYFKKSACSGPLPLYWIDGKTTYSRSLGTLIRVISRMWSIARRINLYSFFEKSNSTNRQSKDSNKACLFHQVLLGQSHWRVPEFLYLVTGILFLWKLYLSILFPSLSLSSFHSVLRHGHIAMLNPLIKAYPELVSILSLKFGK